MPTKRKKKAAPRGKSYPKGVTGNPSGKNQYSKPPEPEAPPAAPDNTEQLLELIDRLLGESQRPEVRKNLQLRRRLLVRLREQPGLWKKVRAICKRKIVLYILWFGWQYNPLKLGAEVGPFVPYDYQEAAFEDTPETTGRRGIKWCYEQGVSLVAEKSREQGASWQFLFFVDHDCRFNDWRKWLVVSRDADAVDKAGDPDALFWKLDFIHEYLPAALQGERKPGKDRKRFHIYYPGTRSTTTGQASTGKAGVGGRAHGALIDEFPMIEEDKQVRQRTASTARMRIFNGTHQGTGTEFYRLTLTPEIAKIVMHWSQHPDKNQGLYSYDQDAKKMRYWEYVPGEGIKELPGPKYQYPPDFEFIQDGSPTGGPFPGLRSPWYDAKARDIGTSRAVAMELDIDPKGSVSSPFDPMLIHRLKQFCKPPVWEGDIEYDAQGDPVKLVEVQGGPLKLWCRLIDGKPPKAPYYFGADVSAGTGATPSCLSGCNGRTGEKSLEYSNAHIAPDKFGLLAAAVCKLFRDKDGSSAKIAWENVGSTGIPFGNAMVKEGGHRNVYKQGEEEPRRGQGVLRNGFMPTQQTKNLLLGRYIQALKNGHYLNYSEPALDECLEFRYDSAGKIMHAGDVGDNPEAARENHGDMVIADALSCKIAVEGGRLASQRKEEPPPVAAEDNIMTYAGRRALRQRQAMED